MAFSWSTKATNEHLFEVWVFLSALVFKSFPVFLEKNYFSKSSLKDYMSWCCTEFDITWWFCNGANQKYIYIYISAAPALRYFYFKNYSFVHICPQNQNKVTHVLSELLLFTCITIFLIQLYLYSRKSQQQSLWGWCQCERKLSKANNDVKFEKIDTTSSF